MNKAFSWNWIINGLIIGIVVIGIFFGILNKMFLENARQDAKDSFKDIWITGNNLCKSGQGDETFLELKIPDIVEGIYVSMSETEFADDFQTRVDNGIVDIGNKICLKIRDEQPYCENLQCELEMSDIGSKRTVLSLADRLVKKSHYQDVRLYFSKGECGSSILLPDAEAGSRDNACVVNPCDYTVLMGCNRQPAAVLVDENAVVISDTTPFCQGTGSCTVPDSTIEFSVNVASRFNGARNRMLIIWEDNKMDMNQAGFDEFISRLSEITDVVTVRHDTAHPINNDIINYDQVWIFRPSWCYGQNTDGTERINSNDCTGVKKWDGNEIELIETYINAGGKVLLTAEYSSIDDDNYMSQMNIRQEVNYPQEEAANKILAAIDENLYFDTSGCFCGCKTKSVTNYADHELLENVRGFSFDAATRVLCE